MTISHRVTRSSSSSVARHTTTSSQHEQAVDPPADEGVEKDYLRGSADLPPIITNEQDRPLITPDGNSHWSEVKGRTPSSVLTCLLKKCHPGLIKYRGKKVVASTWKHYQAAKDTDGKSAAEFVEEGFWLRFRFDPAKEAESRDHVGVSCGLLLGSIMYYARIYATKAHFSDVVKRKVCDKIAGQFYLTREEYIEQRQVWCKQDCWDAMATKWSSSKFKDRSEANRANRYSRRFKTHKGGSSSIAIIRQRLSKKLGRQVTDVEAWVHTHRGTNPDDTTALNTEEATACLDNYKAKAMELNGQDFDWLHSPVDVRALYQWSCGRRHGKWATFNGIVNDRAARAELQRSRASSMAAKRQQQEEENRLRKEAQDSNMAKAYAQSMLQWGTVIQAHYDRIHSFMEAVALQNGMPATDVPPPLPLPPQYPTYGISLSPNLSPENADTFGSYIRGETPEEILCRIAYGGFGRHVNANSGSVDAPVNATNNNAGDHVNATISGGGNYSPPQGDDDFPLF